MICLLWIWACNILTQTDHVIHFMYMILHKKMFILFNDYCIFYLQENDPFYFDLTFVSFHYWCCVASRCLVFFVCLFFVKILEIIRVILKLYDQWKNFDDRKEIAAVLNKMPKPKPPPNRYVVYLFLSL